MIYLKEILFLIIGVLIALVSSKFIYDKFIADKSEGTDDAVDLDKAYKDVDTNKEV